MNEWGNRAWKAALGQQGMRCQDCAQGLRPSYRLSTLNVHEVEDHAAVRPKGPPGADVGKERVGDLPSGACDAHAERRHVHRGETFHAKMCWRSKNGKCY